MPKTIEIGSDEGTETVLKETFTQIIPDCPGVYFFYDENATLLYVGKAKNLKARLRQYQTKSRRKIYRKTKELMRKVCKLQYEKHPDEQSALLRENQVIQEEKPPYNVAGAYSFLYPFFGLKRHPDHKRWLTVFYSTNPEFVDESELEVFGAFRSRRLCKATFEALKTLLELHGHIDRQSSRSQSQLAYTTAVTFRQVSPEAYSSLQSFLSGESADFLAEMTLILLENPDARAKAQEVQQAVKILKRFFQTEAMELRGALLEEGREDTIVLQQERDPLFIRRKFKD